MNQARVARAPLGDWLIVAVCFLALAVTYSGRAILGVTFRPLLARSLVLPRATLAELQVKDGDEVSVRPVR